MSFCPYWSIVILFSLTLFESMLFFLLREKGEDLEKKKHFEFHLYSLQTLQAILFKVNKQTMLYFLFLFTKTYTCLWLSIYTRHNFPALCPVCLLPHCTSDTHPS